MSQQTQKKRKSPIKFGIQLNDEQKEGKAIILQNEITIVDGKAGSGKSLLACQVALDGLFTGQYSRITIARPAVTAGEDIGFLPGSKEEKLAEFIEPVMDNINLLYGDTTQKRNKIEKHLTDGDIDIASIGHLRGKTFCNEIIIVDEAQNLTEAQMEMVVTRLGKGSKMIITGDLRQKDLKGTSGLSRLMLLVDKVEGLAKVELTENHRSPIVKAILEEW